jgi:hypothetical protein
VGLRPADPHVQVYELRTTQYTAKAIAHATRDDNGDLIPDSPRGIPPVGDGDGEDTSPAGI